MCADYQRRMLIVAYVTKKIQCAFGIVYYFKLVGRSNDTLFIG